MENFSFESSKHRKAYVADLKREYRSTKHSEKQHVKKFIEGELD